MQIPTPLRAAAAATNTQPAIRPHILATLDCIKYKDTHPTVSPVIAQVRTSTRSTQ